MQKGHILALCVAIAVIFAIWTCFLLAVVTGLMPVSILPAELNTMASVGDTFGILNSLFTGVALAACQRQSKSEPKGSAKCCHFGVGEIAG